ncbi:unnamed protein product, partial [Meganyctiphanes norvegica]
TCACSTHTVHNMLLLASVFLAVTSLCCSAPQTADDTRGYGISSGGGHSGHRPVSSSGYGTQITQGTLVSQSHGSLGSHGSHGSHRPPHTALRDNPQLLWCYQGVEVAKAPLVVMAALVAAS